MAFLAASVALCLPFLVASAEMVKDKQAVSSHFSAVPKVFEPITIAPTVTPLKTAPRFVTDVLRNRAIHAQNVYISHMTSIRSDDTARTKHVLEQLVNVTGHCCSKATKLATIQAGILDVIDGLSRDVEILNNGTAADVAAIRRQLQAAAHLQHKTFQTVFLNTKILSSRLTLQGAATRNLTESIRSGNDGLMRLDNFRKIQTQRLDLYDDKINNQCGMVRNLVASIDKQAGAFQAFQRQSAAQLATMSAKLGQNLQSIARYVNESVTMTTRAIADQANDQEARMTSLKLSDEQQAKDVDALSMKQRDINELVQQHRKVLSQVFHIARRHNVTTIPEIIKQNAAQNESIVTVTNRVDAMELQTYRLESQLGSLDATQTNTSFQLDGLAATVSVNQARSHTLFLKFGPMLNQMDNLHRSLARLDSARQVTERSLDDTRQLMTLQQQGVADIRAMIQMQEKILNDHQKTMSANNARVEKLSQTLEVYMAQQDDTYSVVGALQETIVPSLTENITANSQKLDQLRTDLTNGISTIRTDATIAQTKLEADLQALKGELKRKDAVIKNQDVNLKVLEDRLTNHMTRLSAAELALTKVRFQQTEETKRVAKEVIRDMIILPEDCSTIDGNGVFTVWPKDSPDSFKVLCEDRWTIIQKHSEDEKSNFNRSWSDYKEGFGNLKNGCWIGNDKLYSMTGRRRYKMAIGIEDDSSGLVMTAKYSNFQIEPEEMNYRIRLSGYSGNSGDGFKPRPGQVSSMFTADFSTHDRDNDALSGRHCAHSSGWWFSPDGCGLSDLNGPKMRWSDPWGRKYNVYSSVIKIFPVLV